MGWFTKKTAPDTGAAVRRPADVPVLDATVGAAVPPVEPDAAPAAEPEAVQEPAVAPDAVEEDAVEQPTAPDAVEPEPAGPDAVELPAGESDAAPVVAPAAAEPEAAPAPALRPLGGASRAPRPAPGLSTLLALEAAAAQLRGAQADPEPVAVVEPPAPAVVEQPAPELPAAQPEPAASAFGLDEVSAEHARLERERQARREARLATLAPVAEEDPLTPEPQPAPVRPIGRTTDRLWASLGLFGLRAATAMIMFVHGLNGAIAPKPVLETWSNTVLPAGAVRFVVVGVPWLELLIAALLIVGLATRLAGLALLALMAATLALVMWGPWTIFEPGGTGFLGEHELLLAAVALVFLTLGAGAWSFDYLLRRGREREGLDA